MKQLIYFLLLLGFAFFAQANNDIVKKKTYRKQFKTTNTVHAEVVSSYGDIRYEIGNNKEVIYEVEVIVDGNNTSDVQKKLASISVEFSQDSNGTMAHTQFENVRVKRVNSQINYIVKIPADAWMIIGGNYLDIYLPKVSQKTVISGNYLDIFGSQAIEKMNLKGNYLDIEISSSINQCKANGNYMDLALAQVRNLELEGNYLDFKIVKVMDYGKIKGNYLDFKIQSIGTKNVSLEIQGNYIDGEIQGNESLNVKANGNYSDVDVSSRYQILLNKKKYSSLNFEAQSSSAPNSTLDISGNYVDINLK